MLMNGSKRYNTPYDDYFTESYPLHQIHEYFCDRTQFTPILSSMTYSTDQVIPCFCCGSLDRCYYSDKYLLKDIIFDLTIIVVSIVGAEPIRSSPSDSSYNVKVFTGQCPEKELFKYPLQFIDSVIFEEWVHLEIEFTLNSTLDYVDHPLKHFVKEHLEDARLFLPGQSEELKQSHHSRKQRGNARFSGKASLESYANHFILIRDSITAVANLATDTAKTNPHIGRKQKKK